MLLIKVVCFVYILTQTVNATDLNETLPQGSCGWETFVSYNPNRIPKKITETVCQENGGSCGGDDANAKCHQISALMDVAYVALISGKSVVVHNRNMTVGIGCGCKAMQIQRRQQVHAMVDE